MKKIFITLAVIVLIFVAAPVLAACRTKITGNMTGGACSIDELNNLDKTQMSEKKGGITLNTERDLRPVKIKSKAVPYRYSNCLLKMCLYQLFEGDIRK